MEQRILKRLMRNKKNKLINFLFPVYCLNCGKLNSWLCPDCQKLIKENKKHCFICKKENNKSEICSWCKYISGEKGKELHLNFVYRYSSYGNQKLKNLIWAFKYSNLTDSSFLLASFLTKSLRKLQNVWPLENSLITCIPMNLKHKNSRGYNQAKLLSIVVAQELKLEFVDTLVMNRKRQFRVVNKGVRNRNVILIDDVITSGETINQASLALKKASSKEVYGLSLA